MFLGTGNDVNVGLASCVQMSAVSAGLASLAHVHAFGVALLHYAVAAGLAACVPVPDVFVVELLLVHDFVAGLASCLPPSIVELFFDRFVGGSCAQLPDVAAGLASCVPKPAVVGVQSLLDAGTPDDDAVAGLQFVAQEKDGDAGDG